LSKSGGESEHQRKTFALMNGVGTTAVWGLSKAIDLSLQDREGNPTLESGHLNILLVGASDIRHVLKTISQAWRHNANFTVNLISLAVLHYGESGYESGAFDVAIGYCVGTNRSLTTRSSRAAIGNLWKSVDKKKDNGLDSRESNGFNPRHDRQ
jgi:hypothetical protein